MSVDVYWDFHSPKSWELSWVKNDHKAWCEFLDASGKQKHYEPYCMAHLSALQIDVNQSLFTNFRKNWVFKPITEESITLILADWQVLVDNARAYPKDHPDDSTDDICTMDEDELKQYVGFILDIRVD